MLVPLYGIRIIGKVPWKAPSPDPWDTSGRDPKKAPSGLWGSQAVGRRKTQVSRRWILVRDPSGFPQAALHYVCFQCKVWICPVVAHLGTRPEGEEDKEAGYQMFWNSSEKIPCLIMTLLTRDNVLFFPESGLGIPLAGLQMLTAYMWYFRNGLNISS